MSCYIFGALSVMCGLTAPLYGQSLMGRGLPRVYEGKNLEAVLLPIGGIGTGNVWIAGSGELAGWQIFSNNLARIGLGDSFLAMRAKAQGGRPVVRALQTIPVRHFRRWNRSLFVATTASPCLPSVTLWMLLHGARSKFASCGISVDSPSRAA